MIRISIALMLSVTLVAGYVLPVRAESLTGDRFITAMNGNSLAGTNAHGERYYLYFLPGGYATYRAVNGEHDTGRWHLSSSGDVCVSWANLAPPLGSGCYHVASDGPRTSWSTKSGVTSLRLQGYVSSAELERSSGGHSHGRR